MPDHAPVVSLNIADNRLDQPGYVRRWYPSTPDLWGQSENSNVYRWPGVRCVTLEPVYEPNPAEIAADQWTNAGTSAAFTTVTGAFGSSGPVIVQQAPGASALTCTSDFTPADNQPCYVDLWFGATYTKTWYADLRFCRNWALRFLYNGTVQVFRNLAFPGETANWQYMDSIRGEAARNRALRLAIYPTAAQELILWLAGTDPLVIKDAEPLASVADGVTYYTTCQAAPVVLYVSGGQFYFSYRYMRFETTGSLTLPVCALPWTYTGGFTLEGAVGSNRSGYAPTVTGALYDEAETELTSPATDLRRFMVGVDLTSDNALFTPELRWAELRIDPTSQAHAGDPLTITEHGRLVSASCGAELRGARQAKLVVSNLDGAYSTLWPRLRMAAMIADADTSATLWKGYLTRTTGPVDQTGDSRMEWDGSDALIRLDVPLSDAYIGDGRVHTDFVEALFKRAGLGAADYSIAVDPLSLTLPEALGEDEPLFQARDGKTIREMVEYICKQWSGWELYVTAAGVITYGPIVTTGAAVTTLLGYHTAEAGYTLYHNLTTVRDESNFFNVIVVVGEDPAERPLLAYHYDAASVGDPANVNYLGFEKTLIVVDSNLRTIEQVQAALAYVMADHATPLEQAECDVYWHETLDVGQIVSIAGYGETSGTPPVTTLYRWQITSLERRWSPDATLHLTLRKVGL